MMSDVSYYNAPNIAMNDARNPPAQAGFGGLPVDQTTDDAALTSLWDQLAANILLTAQALQQLHHAFDQRFTR